MGSAEYRDQRACLGLERECTVGWGRQRIWGTAFLIIPLTDKASPEKHSRGYTGKGVKWSQCGEKRWKKSERAGLWDKGGQEAELCSMDKWLSLGIF